MRTLARAQRIHLAMLSRGFEGKIHLLRPVHIHGRDVVFFVGWSMLFVLLRVYNIAYLLGNCGNGVTEMSHHLVEVKDLEYAYPDGTPVLRGVSFRITHGETVALIGANGAGKSTLLLQLNGCLVPQAGTVRIGDLPLTKETLSHVRRTVGLVFQDPDDQLFMPLVYDDVAFGPLNLGLPVEEVEERVNRALATVGAVHLKDRPPYRLSGGEKRAVAIAAVLSMSPDILVMDEPTSYLDPKTRRQLIELLQDFPSYPDHRHPRPGHGAGPVRPHHCSAGGPGRRRRPHPGPPAR